MHLITFARMDLSFDQVRQDILATYSDRDVGTNSTPRVKSLCVLCMHQKGLCLLGCAGVYPCMCVCMYVFEGMYVHGIQGTPYILYGRLHCRPWRCWYLSSSINRWRHTQTPANPLAWPNLYHPTHLQPVCRLYLTLVHKIGEVTTKKELPTTLPW